MNISTERISQCNQSEPLADASGRIVDLMNENAEHPMSCETCVMYTIKPEELYILSCEKGRGLFHSQEWRTPRVLTD